MKLGIVTYHRPYNYGGCLQALATSYTLSKLGYTPYFIDYWPEYHREQYSLFSFRRFFGMPTFKDSLFYLKNCVVNFNVKRKRNKVFRTFIEQYIIPQTKPVDENFDVIVYGSDQIWRKQPGLNRYNPVYFANNQFKANKHVAFSASMGILPKSSEEDELLKEYMSHFAQISVRELDLKHYVTKLGFNNVQLTLDPTLLLSVSDWKEVIPVKEYTGKKYVFVYALNGCFEYKYIQQFAQANNLDIKYLDGNSECITNQTEKQTVGPDDFVNLIRNAEYVLSSSFHGLAFSIIFHKEFYVSFASNSMRAASLLDNCCLSERFIPPFSPIPSSTKMIDYSDVEKKLQKLRVDSINFLKTL